MTRDLWKDWRTWGIVAAIFTALGVVNAAQFRFTLVTDGEPVGWWDALVGTLPFWWAKALLLPGVLLAARRFPVGPGQWGVRLIPHLPFSVLYAVGHIALGGATGWLHNGGTLTDPAFADRLVGLFTAYGVIGVVYYWAFLGTIIGFDYHRRFRERERAAAELEIRASRLESSLARASLDTLRMQLNPHFLFNTLNSISVLAQTGERDGVVRMLSRLSDLLRTTLERADPEVALADELAFLDTYLAIEQVRFGDRLSVERRIEPRALDAVIPGLLLQPLVENALKHGLGGVRGPVRVVVEARVEPHPDGPRLRLVVADSGPGFPRDRARRLGVGLANTRARLEQLYDDDHALDFSPPGVGATVTITIPFRAAGSAGAARGAGAAGAAGAAGTAGATGAAGVPASASSP